MMLDLSSSTLGHLLAVANSGEDHQTVPGKSLCYHYNHDKKTNNKYHLMTQKDQTNCH